MKIIQNQILFAFALIVLGMNLTFGRTYPWSLLGPTIAYVFFGILTCLMLANFTTAKLAEKSVFIFEKLLSKSIFFKILIVIITIQHLLMSFYFKEFGYGFAYYSIAIGILGLLFFKINSPKKSLCISLLFLAASIIQFPVHPQRSDMLPVIEQGLKFLLSGHDPFQIFYFENGGFGRMPYLPLTFLSHLPAHLLSIDLRWNHFLYRLIWGGLLIFILNSNKKQNFTSVGLFHLILLNPLLNWRHELYFEIFSVLIVAYFLFSKFRWLTLPLLFFTRQWSWVFGSFLFLSEVFKKSLKQNSIKTVFGFFIVLTPVFLLFSKYATWDSAAKAIFQFQEVSTYQTYHGDPGLTLAPFLYFLNLTHWIQPMQGLFILFLFIFSIIKKPSSPEWLGFIAISIFIILNAHYWNYFWLSPLTYLFCVHLKIDSKLQNNETP